MNASCAAMSQFLRCTATSTTLSAAGARAIIKNEATTYDVQSVEGQIKGIKGKDVYLKLHKNKRGKIIEEKKQ